jgi:hypothetical protein
MIAAAVDECVSHDRRAGPRLIDGATHVLLALHGLRAGVDELEQSVTARP